MQGAGRYWVRKVWLPCVKILLLAIGLSMMASSVNTTASDLAVMLPGDVRGWKPEGPDSIYNSENLYQYIDGAAEVYRWFNVRAVLSRRYVKNGASDILVDVFDMGSSKDAFGAYYHDMREGPEAGIGQNSEFMRGVLYFWKGCYFVSIIAFDETEESERAVLELGKAIAGAISDPGSPPDLLKLLPKKERFMNRVHYFHSHHCLNSRYFLAEENLLKLDQHTEGLLARYRCATGESGSSSFVFLLIRYPSVDKAREAYESFMQGYLPGADADGAAEVENGRWSAARLKGKVLVGVFDSLSKNEVMDLFAQLEIK